MRDIRSLTSLRGVAAMMVVLQHFSATLQQHSRVTIPSLVPHGYVAVDLFFVLSGFIMALTYGADFERRGIAAFPSFLLRRVARIIPLNTFAVGLIVLAALASQAILGSDIFYHGANLSWDALCNLLLLQGMGIGANMNAPSWSISAEFVAYLLFPILVLILPDRSRVARAACALVAAVVLCGVAARHPRLGLDTDSISGQFLRCIPEFVIGLATWRVVQSPEPRRILSNDITAIAAGAWFCLMLLLRVDLLAVAAVAAVLPGRNLLLGLPAARPAAIFLALRHTRGQPRQTVRPRRACPGVSAVMDDHPNRLDRLRLDRAARTPRGPAPDHRAFQPSGRVGLIWG